MVLAVSLLLDGRRRFGCHQQRPGAFAIVDTDYLTIIWWKKKIVFIPTMHNSIENNAIILKTRQIAF